MTRHHPDPATEHRMHHNAMNPAQAHATPQPAGSTAPGTSHPLSSHDLLRGQSAVTIAHNGLLYRLQATRQGKLILTK